MKIRNSVIPWCLVLASIAATVIPANAQDSTTHKQKRKHNQFFETLAPLDISLTLNLKQIRRDRADSVPWRSATLTTLAADGKPVIIPLKVKTRGIYRRKKCDYPPLRLNFAKDSVKGTEFEGLNKPKLATFCKDNDLNEQYIIEEFQLYRVYQLLTPYSHKVRLVRLSYIDSASGKLDSKRYAFIQEEPEAFAERSDGKILKQKGARADDLDPHSSAIFGLFEYMIANTDVSISALHNAELLSLNVGLPVAVAFDFDFSGAIYTTYATPDPKLNLESVRVRTYRGYCVEPAELNKAIGDFNAQKQAIFALYDDQIGRLISANRKKSVLDYFSEFYKTINNPGDVKRELLENCIGQERSDAPNR